jgi:5-methylcytosine-specific restriction endonuclease McrA
MTKPHEDCGWTKARYFSFIRSALRAATMRYPAKQKYLNRACRTAPANMRAKYVCDCELCGEVVGKSKAEVDHINPAGSLRSYEDLPGFVERLFCGFDNFQILCPPCHEIKTLADRKGITFKEATKEKEVIAFAKLPVTKQKAQLKKLKVAEEDMSNQDKRTKAFRKLKGN